MLDAPTDVLPVVAPAHPHPHPNGFFDGRDLMITRTPSGAGGRGAGSQPARRAVGVLAAVVGGVLVVAGLADGASSSTRSNTAHTPSAGETLGTSALGCEVQSMGPTVNATMTDPVCTRAAIVNIACGLDVSNVDPVERYYSTGNYYLWADSYGSMAQFTTTVSSTDSTTRMTCQSGGRVQQLQFTGNEWNEFNGIGTLSSAMRTKLASA